MNDFERYIKKCDLSLKDDVIITYENVEALGKFIALLAIKRVMHCYGERGYQLYNGLIKDILYKKGTNETYSDGYDVACEAICFLCEFIGKSLGDTCSIENLAENIDIRYACFKTVFRYIRKNETYVSHIADINHPNIIEMSVPFETESVKEKEVDVNRIMRKLNMTQKQTQVVKMVMSGINPYQVSFKLKLSNPAIYARLKQVRKKYIKVFGLPYSSYVY